MKTNFAKKIFKISAVAILGVFVLMPVSFYSVKASHIEYQYDSSLSIEENYEKAGHSELYQTFLDELEEENQGEEYDPNSYEGKAQEILNRETENIYENGEYKGSTNSGKFTYTLLQPLPQEGPDLKENVTLEEYLTWAFRFTLALAGFLAVMMIVIGGVEYIISGASEASRSDAKKRINNAISGLVLALVSYLVLYTINPSLVDFENNQFLKEKTTNSSNNSNNTSNNETNNSDNSSSNIGDNLRGAGVTEIEDVPFDFGEQQ